MLRLKELRLEREISQMELSKMTGLTQAYLSELEHGKKQPSLETLIKLTEVFGCTVDDLILKAV